MRPPCGTERGYRAHLYWKEVPCDACRAAHAERQREYYAANPDRRPHRASPAKYLERAKRYQRRHRDRLLPLARQREMERRHGKDAAEVITAMWSAQEGLCYLCQDPLESDNLQLDHDHRCCPRNRSCAYCRRGLACPACNALISRAGDDPARLRKIADNLEEALRAVDARLARKPLQATLDDTSM